MEADDDMELPFPGLDPEAAAQALFQRELLAALEGLSGGLNGFDAGRNEGAEVVAQMIVGEEEPLTVDVGEVIWIDDALLSLLVTGLAVGDLELPARRSGFGQRVESLQVQDWLGTGAKGDGLLDVT